MGLFKQRKNKRFSYQSRLNNENLEKPNIGTQWDTIRNRKSKGLKLRSLPVLIALLVMALILLYFLQTYE